MTYRGHTTDFEVDEKRETVKCRAIIGGKFETFESNSVKETIQKFEQAVDEFEELKEIWHRAREIPAPAPKLEAPEAEDLPDSLEVAEQDTQNEARPHSLAASWRRVSADMTRDFSPETLRNLVSILAGFILVLITLGWALTWQILNLMTRTR